MKTYPYIGKSDIGNITLFTDEKSGLSIFNSGAYSNNEYRTDWAECGFKNITHEYLSNTYGEVVSPEHAEFIIELARANGLPVYSGSPSISRKLFTFNPSAKLFFYDSEGWIDKDRCKQITIPLPPKADKQESSDWSQVGDEVFVCTDNKRLIEIKDKQVKVIGKCTHSDGSTILTVEHDSLGVFAVAEGSWIKKPKTPEEELLDEIVDIIDNASCSEQAAEYIVEAYGIKKPR